MDRWETQSEKLKGIYESFEVFRKERNKMNGSEKWDLKTISNTPLVLEVEFNGEAKEITSEEMDEKEMHILFTQFIVSRTKEELLFKTIAQIIYEKFDL